MSYFLREIISRDVFENSPGKRSTRPNAKISEKHADLLRVFHTVSTQAEWFRLPAHNDSASCTNLGTRYPSVSREIIEAQSVVGLPSSFATVAIAKYLLEKYGRLLCQEDEIEEGPYLVPNVDKELAKFDPLSNVGISSIFDILLQLSRRDPELCVQALSSLFSLLQTMAVDSLRHEPQGTVTSMMSVLKQLREEGSNQVCARASASLTALSVASGQPSHIVSAIEALITGKQKEPLSCDSNYDMIQIPENLHKLGLKVQQKIYSTQETNSHSPSWNTRSLEEHRLLCAFDIPQMPTDSPTDTPEDDMRLHGSVASDGKYLYVLNYIGLYKLGTGMNDTILGKLYAANGSIRATKNSMLTFCNSSLYLRRGQSSCISVLDTDSLRDIGEIMLPTSVMQSAIFSDGSYFYSTTVNQQSTIILIPLNDSFVPSSESKARKKYRLTDVSYHCLGDTKPVPHELPLNLPNILHGQAVDLHIGCDIAFVQSRNGKIFYAGNGAKFGLQETANTWMELILPDPVVQMAIGFERVLFRSGSGQIWVAGIDENRKIGKLKRLPTINRRKSISIACSSDTFAYVTENGRVFMGGKHNMKTHPETGHILGLEGIHMVTIAIGKTHVVSISRHGYIYTWGLNNLNQCGRTETIPTLSPNKGRNKDSKTTECTQHYFIVDVPSICIQCGNCSARGTACTTTTAKGEPCVCGTGESSCLRCGICRACTEVLGEAPSGEQSTPSRTFLEPSCLFLTKATHDVKAASISCGNFHTLVLAADRRVFSFGSNVHGQLGVGDSRPRLTPVQIILPKDVQVVQVAAGANHSVLRTSCGSVYTFGAHKQNQLGRQATDDPRFHCVPGKVDGFGPGQAAFASWVGATGDATLIHSHKSLITNDDVIDAQIVSTKNDLFVFPRHIGMDYIALRRKQGTFAHFQLGPAGLYTSWCLEPRFDVLWSYNAAEMRIQAHTSHFAPSNEPLSLDPLEDLSFLRCPEFALPNDLSAAFSSTQLGINLLSYLYAITTIYKSDFWSDKQFAAPNVESELSTPDGYSIVTRFQGTGGGWGYSAHSVEAIQFMVNRDIKLLGIGLYGGRGEYISKIKVLRLLGMDADELYVEHLTESDETIYECSPRETASLMLSQPVLIKAHLWHVISAKISGPSSDCGAAGKALVSCEDVIFQFRNSMVSNNGTDVNVGQIPELYYQVDTQPSTGKNTEQTSSDDLSLSKIFTSQSLESVNPALFTNLNSVLHWGLKNTLNHAGDSDEKVWEAERSAVVTLMVLRLLGYFWQFVYLPSGKVEPSWDYATAMVDLHEALLGLFQTANGIVMVETYYHRLILSEAVRLFHSLSHVFMSTRNLVACHLADIMSGQVGEVYIAAVLGSIEKKKNIVNLLLRQKQDESFLKLGAHLENKFNMNMVEVNTLTNFSNIMRYLYDRSFHNSANSYGNGKYDVSVMAQNIIVSLSEQLVVPTNHVTLGPTVYSTPSRFRRRSSVAGWNMCNSAPDAILFRLEGTQDIMIHGIAVYVSPETESGKIMWNCEIYKMRGTESENLMTVCNITSECSTQQFIGILRLPFPIRINPEDTCGVKVWTSENSIRTYCGEGGLSQIRLENGGRIHFNTSSLSENGTTFQRGQIPFLLYSLQESDSLDKGVDREETHKAFFLLLRLLSNSIGASLSNGAVTFSSRTLMSRISGHVMVFMERHPEKAIEIMSILEQLMPMVSSLNGAMKASTISESFDGDSEVCEAKTSQIVVESPHPYKPNSIHSVVVGFDSSVDFMCVQFSSTCQTAQMDDTLWMYVGVKKDCYIPVGKFFGSRDWPKTPIMLPGNSIWFVLETQSQVEGLPSDQMYGFHCTITGYPTQSRESGLLVEQELAWLSASACRILVQLPTDPVSVENLLITEDDTRLLLEKHGSLLKRGLSLTHQPTLNEVMTKGIPPPAQTPDILFLREFVAAVPTTTSGLLAHWLPAGPVVDATKCLLSITQTEMNVGKTVPIRVSIKDQYDRPVVCPQLEIEVTMHTGSKSMNTKSFCANNNNNNNNNGNDNTSNVNDLTLDVIMKNPFQPFLTNRSRYMSICAMPVFSNYSNEEIRLALEKEVSVRESVKLRHFKNSTYMGEWVPTVAGTYRVECRIDGFELSHTYTLHVSQRDNNEQETRVRKEHRAAQLSRAQVVTVPVLSDFRSLRMRSSPSLNAPCLGTVPRGGTLSYIEVVENDDGKWLRLTDDTSALYGNLTDDQVWCMAYSNPLRRELIPTGSDSAKDVDRAPVRRQTDHPISANVSSQRSVVIDANEIYILEAGESIPLYTRPSPEGLLEGDRLEGRKEISSDGWVSNSFGVWIKLSGTQRFALIESVVGKSSIHSQSFSTNGNEEEEASPLKRAPVGVVALSALRPLVADCTRAVFAAFLWHEHLVKDAMAAATYLKFHQHLHNMWSSTEQQSSTVPPALQPIVRLWNEVCQAVQASIDQHLIMPPSSATICKNGNRVRTSSAGNCELCEEAFKGPSAVHMRMAHPGCGNDSQGYGYNSKGKLTTGWTGECGSGGRTGSAWYLMCPTCRGKYLKMTPSGFRQERTKRWREFRLSATSFESRPEVIIKQNALFLLDLNSSIDCDSKSSSTSSGWTVNLFPTQTPSPVTRSAVRSKIDSSQLVKSSFMVHSSMRAGHSSDPGPKVPLMSPPTQQGPTSSLGQYRAQQAINENQEVLQSPSAALRTLLSSNVPSTSAILKRPVMSFVLEHHDLKKIRDACELSIRRAVSFSHAFRVWNWLLRLVSSETSVSDIIFQYLTALSSYNRLILGSQSLEHQVLPHPWRLCYLAGPLAVKVVHHLHSFLYTIAVILQSSGVDAKLRSLCFKAWTIQLTVHEQELLILTCNILATVGGVLSDGSTSENWISDSSPAFQQDNVDVKEMKDLTSLVQIEASSRQAMVVCLQDGSPETFWESGEEDKTRRRWLSVKCDVENITPVLLCIFIDNAKDEAYRTEEVTFRGTLTSDGSRKEILHKTLELNFSNWIICCIAGTAHVQISLKGSSNALRVRQLALMGFSARSDYDVIRPSTSHQLFFSNTQLDAFTLFQAISAQAFGSELSEDQQGTLRERVVDLLCSRVQLQPLQNYVGTQVVNALEREVDLLCSQTKRNYSYACGLLDMLERICATRKGGELFAARNTILIAISQLIIFAPQVVQCQGIHVLEKLLSFFSPETVDIARFLKNILIVVAKVITLQVRDKASHSVATAIMNDSLITPPPSWRVDRGISPEIGRLITQLMSKLTSGMFSPEWTQCVRHELASALLNVVHLTSSICSTTSRESLNREGSTSFLGSKRFWLSVAALALVKDKSWLTTAENCAPLEAQKEEKPETLCENHDDGQTIAQVFCTVCEIALCRECFTVMHLHKKNRSHQVEALTQPSHGADVDIHQGCARMRLQHLLVLFHGDSLNGLVEISLELFPHSSAFPIVYRSTATLNLSNNCRFCGNPLDGQKQMFVGVCDHADCAALAPLACEAILPCGHFCSGINGEANCLPCLTCNNDANQQDGDDVCVVCFTDRLAAAPTVKLECGHLFHFHCLKTILEKRWNGPRIHFRFINCPLCNQQISHPGLSDILEPILKLKEDVMDKAKMRLGYDGLMECAAIRDDKSEFFNKPEEYAMERYMYVLCSKCNKAYFGGESRCQLALNSSQYNPEDLMCGGCSDTTGTQVCGRHGVEYLEYKCRYCCSIAVYFCFGTTHFCAACHDDFQRLVCLPKTQLPRCPAGPRGIELDEGPCPLKMEHPPTGDEFAMGCGICRNINTF